MAVRQRAVGVWLVTSGEKIAGNRFRRRLRTHKIYLINCTRKNREDEKQNNINTRIYTSMLPAEHPDRDVGVPQEGNFSGFRSPRTDCYRADGFAISNAPHFCPHTHTHTQVHNWTWDVCPRPILSSKSLLSSRTILWPRAKVPVTSAQPAVFVDNNRSTRIYVFRLF